jgi:hypothetical protein
MRRGIAFSLLLPLLAACGGDEDAMPGARHQIHGTYTVGESTHHFVATFQDSVLIAVEEEQQYGDLGRGRTRYEVVQGRLVAVRTEEQRRPAGPDSSGAFETVILELEFDPAGELVRQSKRIDGEPAELLGYEAPGARRHFQQLRQRVDAARRTAAAGM